MRILTVATMCALGLMASDVASAQGPVREGLRRTGEAVAEGTRTVVQGAAEATERAASGVAGAAGSAFDRSPQARWRFQRRDGRWWYYTPENRWMYHSDGQWQTYNEGSFQQGAQNQQFAEGQPAQNQQFQQGQPYSAGYRGVDQSAQWPAQQVRTDAYGRQYICQNGQPVYLDQSQGQFQGQQFQGQAGAMSPTPATPPEATERSALRQDPDQPGLNSGEQGINAQSTVPATPAPDAGAAGDVDANANVSEAPAGSAADVSSGAVGDPAAPRQIGNNPTPATHGAVDQ